MFTQRCSTIFFILFTLLHNICGVWNGNPESKAVPYVAAVKEDRDAGFNLCGAAIISSHFLLSHTPCLYKLRGKVVVVAGAVDVSHPGIVSDIKNVIPHEHYHHENETNPLALVETMSIITGPNSKIIKITKHKWAGYSGCKFAGYGFRVYKEKEIYYRNITTGIIHSGTASGLQYKPSTCGCLTIKEELLKKSELICVSGGDQSGLCIGDPGSPLVCHTKEGDVIVAVAANFQTCEGYDELQEYMTNYRQLSCGHAQSTETYTFVYPYIKWIENEIARSELLKN